MFWPILAIVVCAIAPANGWWFPGEAASPLGQRIDDLFYMILIITTITFVGTQVALGYVLFRGAKETDEGNTKKAWFSHGSHDLEIIWSVVPALILLFIAFYQLDVWAEFRVKDAFPEEEMLGVLHRLEQKRQPGDHTALAEVTARQFEWRIRYPGFDADGKLLPLMSEPQPTDLYTVNDLHLPANAPVKVLLKSDDVQHSFFLPDLRVKQDAVPGLIIPVWFEANREDKFPLLCAELCGWGHYKMKAQLVAESEDDFLEYLHQLQDEQNYDGVVVEDDSADE